jgi:predicted dehydrogenase
MARDRVRFGLVGYGFGGRIFHAPFLATASGCSLAGVVTGSAERRAEVHEDHPDVPVFGSVEELVASGVDAVVVSTPASTHAAVVEEVLRRGLPVVCDKPLAMRAGEARQVVELAERLGALFSVYQNRRWDADFRTVQAVLRAGSLGELRRFESAMEQWSAEPRPPSSGGGMLRDLGSHLVDQAVLLFGPVERVYAETHLVAPELEDDVLLLLQHGSGMRSQLSASWRQGSPRPRFRVTGGNGTLVQDRPSDAQFHALMAGRAPLTEEDDWGAEREEAWPRVHRGGDVETIPSERGRWDLFYEEFARAVSGEGPVPVDPRDAVVTAAVLDTARLSAAQGRVLDVPPSA